ncbi:MAG: GNAT family N-acetyltransferase [Chloroflexi bacterium]|nr:GNAT family N-acetyltransferase [Chloroflexota bacterium]
MADLSAWRVTRLDNKQPIRAFLDRDRIQTAYALGDLDDAFWPQSAFFGASRGGAIETLALVYRGLEPPVFCAFGTPKGVAAILSAPALDLPDEVYVLLPPALEPAFSAYYTLHQPHEEWRMALDPAAFALPHLDGVARLDGGHAAALGALFKHAAEPGEEIVAFSPWQIEHGAFYGVWEGAELIAAAGTHVWSEAERVVAIGNVFTRPDRRGRGHAARCTGAVVRDALAVALDPIVLNVRRSNAAAVHVYQKLGFRAHGAMIEGPALRRK